MSGAFRKAGPKREIDDRRACPDHGVEGGRYRATGAALALGRPDKAWTRPGQGLDKAWAEQDLPRGSPGLQSGAPQKCRSRSTVWRIRDRRFGESLRQGTRFLQDCASRHISLLWQRPGFAADRLGTHDRVLAAHWPSVSMSCSALRSVPPSMPSRYRTEMVRGQ